MKKILILDDKESIAKILFMYLGKENNTIWFDNAKKGLDWLNEGHRPDLIITDLSMPFMNGVEFVEAIKANEHYKDIKIIVLSSNDSTTEKIHLLELGVEDYITKPFNPIELRTRVKNILEKIKN
ncbi:MAG: response regulator [Bacteroidales bacterium]|jgi:DNA-binding response OmpR family regulator|nr:response regulator [Bacteroidales bacterium]